MLEERRVQLIASIDERRGQERDTGREVGDEMDEASTEGVSSMTSKLLERDVQLLNEIDRALARMHEGTYGLCEGTGEPIGYSRLRLRPWARYSVGYQEELERAERGRGGP
jgi:DnaK suppressor protein